MSTIYCRICGDVHDCSRDLRPVAAHMAWWQLRNIVRGLGCPTCEGAVPLWIRDLNEEDRRHVEAGLDVQWLEAMVKTTRGHKPYQAFPKPFCDPYFIWVEPAMSYRVSELDKKVRAAMEAIEGGADGLRVHPDRSDDAGARMTHGLWHVINSGHADTNSDTSSVRALNARVIEELFGDACQVIDGLVWIIIGLDIDGQLTLDLTTLERIGEIEATLCKYHVITPEVCERVGKRRKKAS